MKSLLTILTLTATLTVAAQDLSEYDLNKPFGFCTVSSRTDASSTYDITGGGCYTYPIPDGFTGTVKVLKSNGQDMKGTIQNAIKQNDVVILDGADGDFIVSQSIGFERGNKTIIGINNARLCTQWYITDEIKELLDNATDDRTPGKVGVRNMSTNAKDNLGGTVAGQTIKEQAEYNVRKILYDKYKNENYRKSGIFSLNRENVIIRNITFVGPGSIDASGNDLISATGARHCWIDHCTFQDGMDGNFDITEASNYITVSWCTFKYTARSYMHQNTNLVGSSDDKTSDEGLLNTTFSFNWWGSGCNQRMPMARYGKIHMLNNYFSSTTASNCINPRKNSEFLIEGNYIDNSVPKYYSQSDAKSVTWANNNYTKGQSKPANVGSTVTVPYNYTVASYSDVPTEVQNHAGATLNYSDNPSGITLPTTAVRHESSAIYNLAGQKVDASYKGVVIKNGKKFVIK